MSHTHPLRIYRKRAGLSLDALAKKAGTTKASLSRIEAGKQDASLKLIARIRKATKGAVTPNDFEEAVRAS